MSIVFGSPEAKAILEKDKELQRWEEEESLPDDSNKLADRLAAIRNEIEDLEYQLGGLEAERDEIREKLQELKRPDPKVGYVALKQWNAWATGSKAEAQP